MIQHECAVLRAPPSDGVRLASARPPRDGSTAAFERVSAAPDLGDPERAAYDPRRRPRPGPRLRAGWHDAGHALFRKGLRRILRPRISKYEPFGDPPTAKRDYEREKRRRRSGAPNGATIPPGSSAAGVLRGRDMEAGGILLCQKCQAATAAGRGGIDRSVVVCRRRACGQPPRRADLREEAGGRRRRRMRSAR